MTLSSPVLCIFFDVDVDSPPIDVRRVDAANANKPGRTFSEEFWEDAWIASQGHSDFPLKA